MLNNHSQSHQSGRSTQTCVNYHIGDLGKPVLIVRPYQEPGQQESAMQTSIATVLYPRLATVLELVPL